MTTSTNVIGNSALLVSPTSEKLDLSDMTQCERLGLVKESFLNVLYKGVGKQFKLRVEWAGKHSYDKKRRNQFRRGVDHKLYDENGGLFIAHESKNWKNPKKQYGLDVAQTEVVDRFKDVPYAKFKILSIPNFNVFSWQAREHIIKQGILVFETGKLIGKKDFRSANFYKLKAKLKQFITALLSNDQKLIGFRQQETKKLTESLNNQLHGSPEFFSKQSLSDNNTVPIVVNANTINNKKEDTPSITYQQILEETEIESQILKREETDRLRKYHSG